MGRTLVQLCELAGVRLVGAVEAAGTKWVGQDAGVASGLEPLGVTITGQLDARLAGNTEPIIIDFTTPTACMDTLGRAEVAGFPMVIGTTGFSADQTKKITKAADKIPIVMAPNMSVGVNCLFSLVGKVAAVLGSGYDIEVLEAHHNQKKDAPSGTAVRIAQILAQASGRSYPDDFNFHREGMVGSRSKQEIGMQVIRGGDIVGEHTVYYCGEGERLEIKHVATSRKTFAQGALRAAAWLHSRTAGLYDMHDVLGIPK